MTQLLTYTRTVADNNETYTVRLITSRIA